MITKFFRIWDGLIPKPICLSCRPNGEFHVQKWSFDKKLSNLMHECTSWILHLKSSRKMFWSKMKSFSWILDDKWNAVKWVWRFYEESGEEKLKLDEICFEWKWRSEWKDEKRSIWSLMEVILIQSFCLRWKFILQRLLDPF